MKYSAALVIASVLVFFGWGVAKADEDETLGAAALTEGATVVGDLKFYLFDDSDGESDGVSQSTGRSAGISSAILYAGKEITDNLSAELGLELMVHAGATPRLGQPIEREKEAELEWEFLSAYITYVLPYGIELKAGVMKPLFTWDYGYELFWHEEYHGSYVSTNPWLGSWHDSGIELYKTFEFDTFSLPAYLYLLNGPGGVEVDNNEGMSVLVHVAPEFLQGRLKFLGSYGFGKWDDDNEKDFTRYAVGADFTWKNLNVRGEYMGGEWEDQFLVAEEVTRVIKPKGYYIKAFYRFHPKLRALVGYSHLDHDFSGFFYTASGVGEEYDTVTLGLDYFLAESVTAMLIYNTVEAERDDGSAELDYDRLTLGTRVTF